MATPGTGFLLFAIYAHPADYPDGFVVRRWFGFHPELRPYAVSGTLEEARAKLPPGLSNIGREDNDDPVLAEVWL
jgi:hypothetical protein